MIPGWTLGLVENITNNNGYDVYLILKTGDGGRIQHQNGNPVAIDSGQSVTFGLPEPCACRMRSREMLRVHLESSEAFLNSGVRVVADGKKVCCGTNLEETTTNRS